jgi:hypothetical protein
MGQMEVKFLASTKKFPDKNGYAYNSWMIACKREAGKDWELRVKGVGFSKGQIRISFDGKPFETFDYEKSFVASHDISRVLSMMKKHNVMSVEHPYGQSSFSLDGISQVLHIYLSRCPTYL